MKFYPGDRICISKNYHWAQGATGTIANPPDYAKQLDIDQNSWQDHYHLIQGRKGIIRFIWVWFDEPQKDADGDGPYRGAEINIEAIEHLEKNSG